MRVELFLQGDDHYVHLLSLRLNVGRNLAIIQVNVRTSINTVHTFPMLVLSKAASISSNTKKGAGWKEWMEKRRARAAIVFSPPERLDMGWNLLPGATQL